MLHTRFPETVTESCTDTAATERHASLVRSLRLLLALLALPALLGLGGVLAAPAAADPSTFAGAVNAERRAHGLAPLTMASDLSAAAQRWSQQMASSHRLSHNANLSAQVGGWRIIGENVGMSGSELDVHNALMASPGHRENILEPAFSQIGIGIARSSDGYVWVTQVFRQPVAGSPRRWGRSPRRATARPSTR